MIKWNRFDTDCKNEQEAVTASHSPRDQYDFVEDNVSKTILRFGMYSSRFWLQ